MQGLWSIIAQTDYTTKFILLVLLFMSVICWSIIFFKIMMFRTKLKHLKRAQNLLQKVTTFDDLLTKSALLRDTFAGVLIAQYLSEFKNIIKTQEGLRVLTAAELEILQININGIIEETLKNEETGIPFLSTSAAISPLIGLFGTVWGLIHAFMSISTQKSADIAAVAPGIAEALITTLAGLVVAIPALAMFNYLRVQTKYLEHEILAISEKSLNIMKLATQNVPMVFTQTSSVKTVSIN